MGVSSTVWSSELGLQFELGISVVASVVYVGVVIVAVIEGVWVLLGLVLIIVLLAGC